MGQCVSALWPPDGTWHNAEIKDITTGGRVKVLYRDDNVTRDLLPHQISVSMEASSSHLQVV